MIVNKNNVSQKFMKQLDILPFRAIDRQFAHYLMNRYNADEATALAGAVTSALIDSGHSCLFFDDQSGKLWGDENGEFFHLPKADEWITKLLASQAVGKPGERKPLILDGGRLYIYKYFTFERNIAERLRSMAKIESVIIPTSVMKLAESLFTDEIDLSKVGGQLQTAAVFLPFFTHLNIISGGPGTGKTTVLARLLSLLCADAVEKGKPFPVIKLAAPTGKAAQRMGEAIRTATKTMPDEKIKAHLSGLIPSTLHRLLGLHGNSPKAKRNNQSPLDADIVVVDEASMMDIAIFARLMDALPQDVRLVLLGDRYQLASVDAGCVMADICDGFFPNTFSTAFIQEVNKAITRDGNKLQAANSATTLSPVIELQHSYRFKGGGPIGNVSKAIKIGSSLTALSEIKKEQKSEECSCQLFEHPGDINLSKIVHSGFKPLVEAPTAEDALESLGKFMVLTALNEGRFGREGINQQMYRSCGSVPRIRPIKITENSLQHNLFNGDMGVIIRESQTDGKIVEHAYFREILEGNAPASSVKSTIRSFLVGMLPAFVDAFAITIHNSQGSEFDRVVIVLPEKEVSILTREILYTAITRAKTTAEIYGSEDIFKCAVDKKISRHSGLANRLSGQE